MDLVAHEAGGVGEVLEEALDDLGRPLLGPDDLAVGLKADDHVGGAGVVGTL